MTPSELATIEARANAATPGPWSTVDYSPCWVIAHDAEGSPAVVAPQCPIGQAGSDDADLAFIAAARSDVPALIAEVRRLLKENALLTERFRDEYEGRNKALRERNEALRQQPPGETPLADRRAPVQGEYRQCWVRGPGTVAWPEHEKAWNEYARRYGRQQSPDRIAERAGFGYAEITEYLGHEPTTWQPIK
jgi:hypothetical protein